MRAPLVPLTRAQQKLVADNVRLAYFLVNRFVESNPASDGYQDDMTSGAFEGLMMAAAHYDPDRGIPFGSYAAEGIKLCVRSAWMAVSKPVVTRHPAAFAPVSQVEASVTTDGGLGAVERKHDARKLAKRLKDKVGARDFEIFARTECIPSGESLLDLYPRRTRGGSSPGTIKSRMGLNNVRRAVRKVARELGEGVAAEGAPRAAAAGGRGD